MWSRTVLLMSFTFLFFFAGRAQESESSKNRIIEDLRAEVARLHHDIDSLKSLRHSDLLTQSDMLDRLEESLEKRLTYLETKIDAVSRATAPVAFNPGMTAFINFAARGDSRKVYDLADPANEISNRPFLRTVEMELLGAVDPYASAVAVISLENQAGKEFGVDAEEAYGLLKRIPLLEDAPLGMKVKIGKYRAPFGVSNKIHMHDLPWTTRPLAVARYLGTEHGDFFESGFNPTGMDLNFYVPNPIPQTTMEMNLDVVRAGELTLSGGRGGSQPAYVGHLNLSRDWSNQHLLILGLSAYEEHGSATTRLYGADITYKWAPLEERESHSFVAGGEVFAGRHLFADSTAAVSSNSPVGWYGYLQYQTSYWLYLGLRYDWVEEPSNDRLVTRSIGTYASYYTTEFLRLRLGFEHRWSDISVQNNVNTALLEVNLVFGSHPTEPYWVNK
jgi:hypothetical protein